MTIAFTDSIQEQLPAVSTLVYTAPIVKSSHIIYATVFNASANNVAITINIVKDSDAEDDTNKYIDQVIPAGTTLVLSGILNRVLASGDTIRAAAGAADSLNLSIGTKEVT